MVGPGKVLTCAHVVSDDRGGLSQDITVVWRNSSFRATVRPENFIPKPGIDVALLDIPVEANDYALVDVRPNSLSIGDEVLSYGFPDRHQAGDVATFEVENPNISSSVLAKLKFGQAEPGMSGAPVLNLATGAVCGILRYTRDRNSDLGARLITLHVIKAELPSAFAKVGQSHLADWRAALTEAQLRVGQHPYPSNRLRDYLAAARAAADVHPYALAMARTPPLEAVYVRQSARSVESDDGEERLDNPEADKDTDDRRLGPPQPANSVLTCENGAVVFGGPGAGKSSLLRHLTIDLASKWLSDETALYVPVRISAESLVAGRPLADALSASATREFGSTSLQLFPSDFFIERPIAGIPWLVMVDGIDEILDETLRMEALKVINFHIDSPIYKFLVTSRPLSNEEYRLVSAANRPIYFLEPFSEQMLPVLASRWFSALGAPNATQLLADLTRQLADSHLRPLARIPLIATMICIVYAIGGGKLPASRPDLYAKFVECLLGKQINLDIRSRLKGRVAAYGPDTGAAVDSLIDLLLPGLEKVAYLRQRGERKSVEDLLYAQFRNAKPDRLPESLWLDLLREAGRQCGLLEERGTVFSFLHQTIEEYLAARELSSHVIKNARRRAQILLGTDREYRFSESLRRFLVSIWLDTDDRFDEVLRQIVEADTDDAAALMSATILDGGIIPDSLTRSTLRLLNKRLGWRAIDSSGLLSIEAIVALEEQQRTSELTRRAINEKLDLRERLLALTNLGSISASTDLDRVRGLALSHGPGPLRLAAADVLATSGDSLGREVLISLANDRDVAVQDRIAAAAGLQRMDAERSREELVRLSRDVTIPAMRRLDAAMMLHGRDDSKLVELLTELSYMQISSPEYYYIIAAELSRRRRARGRELYWKLISDRRLNDTWRIEAAIEMLRFCRKVEIPEVISVIAAAFVEKPAIRLGLAEDFARRYSLNYGRRERLGLIASELASSLAVDQQVPEIYRIKALRSIVQVNRKRAMELIRATVDDPTLNASVRRRLGELLD